MTSASSSRTRWRNLRRSPKRDLVGTRVEVGDDRAALHGVGDEALVDDSLRDADLGIAGCLIDVAAADLPFEADVVLDLVVHQRRAILGGLLGVGYGVQRLVLHVHERGGVRCHGRVVGDHSGHGVAHAAHLADGERRMRHLLGVGHDPAADEAAELVGELFAGVDGHHAVGGLSGGGVYSDDVGVRVGAPHQRQVQHAHHLDVVDVGTLAGYEPGVFTPLDARAKRGSGRSSHAVLLAEPVQSVATRTRGPLDDGGRAANEKEQKAPCRVG